MNENRPPVDLRAVCYKNDEERSEGNDDEISKCSGMWKRNGMCYLGTSHLRAI